GPSGFEARPAKVFADAARGFADRLDLDAYGSVYATVRPGGRPHVLLAGHVDEIGLLVTYVDDQGFVYVTALGGWDPLQLIGQRVRVLGHAGDVAGVIGRKATHLMDADDKGKLPKLTDLWIDIGAKDRADAEAHVRPGDAAVLEQPVVQLLNGRLVARALDDRVGAYIALEVARRSRGPAAVTAVATVQEEIDGMGARVAAQRTAPDVAIALDVTHAIDTPGLEKKEHGATSLGSGAQLSVGSYAHRGLLERLRATAERHGIPVTLGFSPRRTATDADHLAYAAGGVPTTVVSIPNRYMHSPNEMVDLADVAHVIDLLVAFVDELGPDDADGLRSLPTG
ncbi:MAG: M20/M25/M40 family metallo-hydrolase, partial [Trueperaceae bacterium]|nr:M20/M25/M40 family metallo-hydrolase [Trueperaceae bacterium]